MSKIQQRSVKNIILTCANGIESTFQVSIPLTFKPDEVIVRQLSYSTSVAPIGIMMMLYTNLVDDQIIGVFPEAVCTIRPDTRFFLPNYQLNQTVIFQVQDFVGSGLGPGPVMTIAVGQVGITLEFIKYKTLKD